MNKAAAALVVLMLLTGCKGGGLANMNRHGVDDATPEEKAEDSYWDYFYGRKKAGLESKDWKDYYKAPSQDDTKPSYCGFWGNCAGDAGVSESQKASCNFYGNCKDTQIKNGWW